jgi:hypothetical protein
MKIETKTDLQKQIEKQQETIINLQRLLTVKMNVVRDESRVALADEIKLDARRYAWLRKHMAELFITGSKLDKEIDKRMKK